MSPPAAGTSGLEINQTTDGAQQCPAVATAPSGRGVAAWKSLEGEGQRLVARLLSAD